MGEVKHPAKFSEELIPIFALALQGCNYVLDPFAGTGRIHELRKYGYSTMGVEIEPEWADMHPDTIVGDALQLPFANDEFDAICTSPTYGNRFADKHNAQDGSTRRGYTHDLGRQLHENNSGGLQWGYQYRDMHLRAWDEAVRVLRPGGTFVLNVKDHIRNGQRQYVAGWHVTELCLSGLNLQYHVEIQTPGFRMGENNDVRIGGEQVYVFEKD